MEAHKYAGMAMDEYEKVKKASEDADVAEDAAAAIRLQLAAEMAQEAAEGHARMADDYKTKTETAVGMELQVDGKVKTVDGTSITVDGSGNNKIGLLDTMNITQAGKRDAHGHEVTGADTPDDATDDIVGKSVTIGVTYDSDDDEARLTLVHSYLGEQKQKQFIRNGEDTSGPTFADGATAIPDADTPFHADDAPGAAATNLQPEAPDPEGAVDTIPTGSVEVPYANANAALGLTGDAALVAPTAPVVATATRTANGVAGIPRLAGNIAVAFDGIEDNDSPALYYISTGVRDNSLGADDDGIDQTKIFLERRVVGNVVSYDVVHVREVTIDKAEAFEHIHYGLWNDLDNGTTVAERGIAFVTALSDGSGMTAADDMPNHGDAKYNGNWVANVQMAHLDGNGDIQRQSGAAMIDADFADNDIDVTLSGLATLDGSIDGNMFSGTKIVLQDSLPATADVIDANYGLDGSGDFEGTFEGGFFGPRAAEAGGIFDFASDDNKAGAFRGSFGGSQAADATID